MKRCDRSYGKLTLLNRIVQVKCCVVTTHVQVQCIFQKRHVVVSSLLIASFICMVCTHCGSVLFGQKNWWVTNTNWKFQSNMCSCKNKLCKLSLYLEVVHLWKVLSSLIPNRALLLIISEDLQLQFVGDFGFIWSLAIELKFIWTSCFFQIGDTHFSSIVS